ncbi:hypothetical protein NSE_0903 [Neorickettsia sennetsu str. Miyayama]|uniref:Uncharacterized protein n=1 Tax=Ehrlichia sennetsu (strain ATCC VR-367 / Miyayama) TaxID=222891 RepID=Q2GCM7_EHRS3|nr:hypothetical protein NSE_0903 [Neorickettsia sennetsu str. Miyayama]
MLLNYCFFFFVFSAFASASSFFRTFIIASFSFLSLSSSGSEPSFLSCSRTFIVSSRVGLYFGS